MKYRITYTLPRAEYDYVKFSEVVETDWELTYAIATAWCEARGGNLSHYEECQ